MAIQTEIHTRDEFERFADLPENTERHLEYIDGEIIEMVSNSESSTIGNLISAYITLFARQHHLGFVTGSDGGYRVNGQDLMPDVGFIGAAKQSTRPIHTWIPNAPDLVVEVLSPTDPATAVFRKIRHYLIAGTVVWLVDPEETITIHQPGAPNTQQTYGVGDTLDGGDVLPGFTLALAEVFDANP